MPTNLELNKSIAELTERVERLEALAVSEKPVEAPPTEEMTATYPVPKEYRELADTILNKNFGITIDYSDGNLDFNVIVPPRYSTLTPERLKVAGGVDRRRKIIPPYEGINGVSEYLKLVYSSFNPEYQAMIASDR